MSRPIECQRFESGLPAWLAGRLSPREVAAMAAHATQCRWCRDLLEFASGDRDLLSAADGPDLAASILARTTGGSCRRAEDLLCEEVDGTLAGEEGRLLSAHLEHCGDCTLLLEPLRLLHRALPRIAELPPDETFLSDVLARTSKRPAPERLPVLLAAWWRRSLRRPRFALEVAYSAALAVFLVAGTPSLPIRGGSGGASLRSPIESVAVLRTAPTSLVLQTVEAFEEFGKRGAAGARRKVERVVAGEAGRSIRVFVKRNTAWTRTVWVRLRTLFGSSKIDPTGTEPTRTSIRIPDEGTGAGGGRPPQGGFHEQHTQSDRRYDARSP